MNPDSPTRPPASPHPSSSCEQSSEQSAERIAVLCALAAAVAAYLACLASQDGWFNPTLLLKMTPSDPLAQLARLHDPHFQFANAADHYDGYYYYGIALDPFAVHHPHTLLDQGAYRYGHPLFGWLGDLLSLGQPRVIPAALLVGSLLGMALAGWSLSRLAVGLGGSPWLGLGVTLLPGLLSASSVLTPEPVCAGLVLSGLLAWYRGRWLLAAVPLGLVCLGKEQFVAVPLGLVVWEVVSALRARHRMEHWAAKAVALAGGPIALSLWYVWIHARFHRWSFNYEDGNIGWPVVGWLKTFQVAHNFTIGGTFQQVQIGAFSPPLLVALGMLFLVAAVRAIRVQTLLDVPLLLMMLIVLCQDWRTLLFAHELLRTPAVPALVAVTAILLPRGKPRTGGSAPE
jgi:hypothetical protein